MKKKYYPKQKIISLVGIFLFLLTVTFITVSSILLYDFIREKSNHHLPTIAIVILINILILTVLCVILDAIRRKYTVEQPVRQIVEATERITSGDLTVEIAPSHIWGKYDQYDIIKENINRMVKELSKTEVLRNDFIANVSHEIKTPLSIIENYATALHEEALSLEQRKEYTRILLSASKRLTDLITKILKLNKLENQEIFAEKKEIALGEMLRECILQFEDILETKGLTLVCDIEDIIIYSDANLLELIWNNLISNAIKFTDVGGTITISLKKEGLSSLVTFADTGSGMSAETGAHIFDKFFQGDISHAQEGNGLGLALVKRVIDILGGDITVESVVGEGSIFQVRLK